MQSEEELGGFLFRYSEYLSDTSNSSNEQYEVRKVSKTPRSVIPPLVPIIMFVLVCTSFLDRYLLSMAEKEGRRAVNDEYISQGSDGTRSYHNMNRIQSVFGYQVWYHNYVISRDYGFLVYCLDTDRLIATRDCNDVPRAVSDAIGVC